MLALDITVILIIIDLMIILNNIIKCLALCFGKIKKLMILIFYRNSYRTSKSYI